MSKKVLDFIESNWENCIKENREDNGTLIGLPYKYTVPAVGHFDEIYYWDTFYTNKGLALCGRWDIVKNNTDNMLYLVDKFGFMPNGNRIYYLTNSQQPYLSEMVRDVYSHYVDPVWLSAAYRILNKEYEFWQTKRKNPFGLNSYGGRWPEELVDKRAAAFVERIGFRPENLTNRELADHYITTCESGNDVNARWGFDAQNFIHVDLNSLLYQLESNMAYFSAELGLGEETLWRERADNRRRKCEELLINDGLYFDFNFKTGKFSTCFSIASVYPMFTRMASREIAAKTVENFGRLELEFGVSHCEPTSVSGSYQWGYPMGWACTQFVAVKSLANYGYLDAARRIAEKYIGLVDKTFEKTGNLWEKYNVLEGNVNVTNEYEMPAMMGWTAGTYLAFTEFLKSGNI